MDPAGCTKHQCATCHDSRIKYSCHVGTSPASEEARAETAQHNHRREGRTMDQAQKRLDGTPMQQEHNTTNTNTNTNNQKEEITMQNQTQTTQTQKANTALSAKEFKLQSYNAYLAYVALIEGRATAVETVDALAPIMAAYGYTLTVENMLNTLTVKMTAYGKVNGEQAKKVKSIATFRAFVKGGWMEVDTAPTVYNAGKDPSTTSTSSKSKRTKADVEAELEKALEIIAQLQAAQK